MPKSHFTLIVSLDVHKSTHRAHFEIKETVQTIGKDFSFPNSIEGFNLFFKEVNLRIKSSKVEASAFVMEPTGHFWKNLGYAIEAKGYPLYLVSTEQVYHQRIADDPANSKNDLKDPLTIAKVFRDKSKKAVKARLYYGIYRQLNKASRERLDLSKKLSREKIQLRAILQEINPEFLSFFSSPLGKIAKAVLRNCPTPHLIRKYTIERLAKLFKTYGNGIIGRRKAERLYRHMSKSIGVKEDNQSHLNYLSRTLDRIESYQRQIEEITKEILELAKDTNHNLVSIPGIEPIHAALLVAEIGDISTIYHPKALVKLAGIVPKEWSSGESVKKRPHIGKKGNPFLRTHLYRATLSCLRHNSELLAYYNHLLAKDKPKMVCVFAVANKLLRIIYRVWKDKRPYDPTLVGQGK
jgi:transposase